MNIDARFKFLGFIYHSELLLVLLHSYYVLLLLDFLLSVCDFFVIYFDLLLVSFYDLL